jgi:hypothetical protein
MHSNSHTIHDIRIRYVRVLGNTISSQLAVSTAHGLRCTVWRGATHGCTLEAYKGTLRKQIWWGTAGAHRGRRPTTWGKPTILGVTINVHQWAPTISPSMATATAMAMATALASAAEASAAGVAHVKC